MATLSDVTDVTISTHLDVQNSPEEEFLAMPRSSPIPAAQYLRMSTEDQPHSIPTQRDAIQRYAAAHGFEVIATYADPGKSGLEIRNRPGLQHLLGDVVAVTCPLLSFT